MKHWILYLAAAALVIGLDGLPFSGSDVGKLQPLEVLYLYPQNGGYGLDADTGDHGFGNTPEAAFRDLRACAAGEIFLDTADYVLVSPGAEGQIVALWQELRPGCRICEAQGVPDLSRAAAFLSTHEPEVTLLRLRAGDKRMPVLISEEGEMRLVEP